jgi:pimeloyl-ACP methyl ester carboxylesterase
MTLLTALQKGGNVMNRGSAAAFVHQTELKQTGLAVHLRPCRQGWRRIATAAIALAGLVAGLSPIPAAAAEVPVPVLDWQPCAAPSQHGFECATAQVPLDYGDPQGATIDLAVIRHPATDPAQRLGALFFSAGGPAGAGTVVLPQLLNGFPATLRARFDLVSWDPRGVGASTAVQCFTTRADEEAFFAGVPFEEFPVSRAEERAWIRRYAAFGQVCRERNGDLLAHVSTAESAKDLDLLRQAVGEPQLNYFGPSYGTFLGATYANLFPDRVRAMVLDGNADPVAWVSRGEGRPFLSSFLRQGSDKASAQGLDAFLDLCGQVATAQCAFSAGSAAATQEKWTALLQRPREQSVTLGTPPRTFTYARLATTMGERGGTFSYPRWTETAALLQSLWTSSEPSGAPTEPTAAASLRTTGRESAGQRPSAGAEARYAGPEQALAIICGESPNPRHPGAFRALAALTYARAGDVGLRWSWVVEPCTSWPATATDRYTGPWDQPTANPILVINNIFDPSTPYEGAVAVARALARARLLPVAGYGHSILLNPSTCANDYVSQYVVDGTLPPPGTVCLQDQPPFTPGPSPATR